MNSDNTPISFSNKRFENFYLYDTFCGFWSRAGTIVITKQKPVVIVTSSKNKATSQMNLFWSYLKDGWDEKKVPGDGKTIFTFPRDKDR